MLYQIESLLIWVLIYLVPKLCQGDMTAEDFQYKIAKYALLIESILVANGKGNYGKSILASETEPKK